MKKKLLYIIAFSISLSAVSCSSELDVEPSGSQVSDEQLSELVKENPETVLTPMMLGAIDYMHNGARRSVSNVYGFMVWNLGMDMQGNDMLISKTDNWFADEYMFNNLRGQTNALAADRWYTFYKIVYFSNQILDLISVIPEEGLTDAVLAYKAQALTYRSLAYHYLMCIYQDDYMHGGKDKAGVPLYQTVEPAKGRTPSTEVYAAITKDLKDAIALFEAQGYDPLASATDIDQTVANLVLARVALTTGNYTEAASAADAVIKAGYGLMDESEYTQSGFQDLSLPETIWGYNWADATSNGNTAFASWVSLTAIDAANNKGVYMCIDSRLYDQIPDTDYRKKNFLAEKTVVGKYTYPKYATTKFNTRTFQVDEVFMRLSEAYLLKAEAEARGNNVTAAQQTLFDLVSQRDASYVKSTKTGEDLLKEIFLQSRIELWGEGHEFYTNKRFHVGVDRASSANHLHKAVKPAGKEFTYQIPLSIEINSNPYINAGDQNPL